MTPSERSKALEILFNATSRLTAGAYILAISKALSLPRAMAKKLLRQLVENQDVAYQDLYGATYVMEGFSKPVRITDRFYILPPDIPGTPDTHSIDIRIAAGISFGTGHHPTTRLCLNALDRLFFSSSCRHRLYSGRAADIGTGSGILAIAACLAGISSCTAFETDLNAVSEADRNVAANDLKGRIDVVHGPMVPLDKPLSMIMANLRFPTLKQLAPDIHSLLEPNGTLVLSGAREWEMKDLCTHYKSTGFIVDWKKIEKQWGVLILTRTP